MAVIRDIFSDGLVLDTVADRASGERAFVVDLDGFEGPLDMLLALARTQKVDLSKISILALADQYLTFIEEARKMRLELAADYLVMAAWLAFLKSRLLLPVDPKSGEPSGEDLAEVLAFRLKRLQATREAAAKLMNRNRLGRDIFARGAPEPVISVMNHRYDTTLYDLLTAYGALRAKVALSNVRFEKRSVWSLGEARAVLERLLGTTFDWAPLDSYLLDYLVDEDNRATVLASSFASALELAREGHLDLHQDKQLGPLFLRKRDPGSASPSS